MSVTIGVHSRLVNSTAEKPMGHAESFETNSTSSSTTTTQDSARDPALRTKVFSCLFHSARHVPTVTPVISHAHCPRVSRATPLLYYNILAFDWSPAPQKKNINIKQSKWTVRHLVLSLDFSMLVWDFVKLKSSGPLFGRYWRYPGNQSLSFPDDSIASQKGKHPPWGFCCSRSLRNNQPFWCQPLPPDFHSLAAICCKLSCFSTLRPWEHPFWPCRHHIELESYVIESKCHDGRETSPIVHRSWNHPRSRF